MARAPIHAAGVKLQNMIKRTRRHLFVFVTNRELPPTNNGSEHALRSCAVFRKITNGFRTAGGAKFYADIRSVVETAPPQRYRSSRRPPPHARRKDARATVSNYSRSTRTGGVVFVDHD
jgi:hypothetical protein